jgi:ketosteroid isomerase-like protein
VSRQNVELVRRTFDVLFHSELQDAARAFHADAVWHNTAEFPGPLRCDGLPAVLDFWASYAELFEPPAESGKQEVERIVGGEEVVVVGVHAVGRWPKSGIPVDAKWAAAVQVRDDKISRVDVHGDFSKALKAVGLEE